MKTKNVRGRIFPRFHSPERPPSKEIPVATTQAEENQTQTRKKSIFKNISSTLKVATEPALLVLVPSPLPRKQGHDPSPTLHWPPRSCKPGR